MVAKINQKEPPYSDRIAGLRADLLSSLYEADIERARYYTRAYKQTEGQGPCLRAARGLEETLRHMSIKIEDGETLVGAKTFKKVAGPMGIERSSSSPDSARTASGRPSNCLGETMNPGASQVNTPRQSNPGTKLQP